MFGPSSVSFSAAVWFCLCLVLCSGIVGVLIGDRYQPLGNGPNEHRMSLVENRQENADHDIQRLKDALAEVLDAGQKTP